MTGYGKGIASDGEKTVTVELKSVNHRYLDFGIKLPKNFLFVEDAVKKAIGAAISRGHIDAFLTYERTISPLTNNLPRSILPRQTRLRGR